MTRCAICGQAEPVNMACYCATCYHQRNAEAKLRIADTPRRIQSDLIAKGILLSNGELPNGAQ